MLVKAATLAALSLPILALSGSANASTATTSPISLAQNHRYLNARSSPYVRPKPNLARWAEYSKSSANAISAAAARKARRAEGAVGVAAARYSPLPPLNGDTITKTVAQQIKVGSIFLLAFHVKFTDSIVVSPSRVSYRTTSVP